MDRALTDAEIRRQLEQILDELGKPYTWVSGEVEFRLRSGERVRGQLRYLEPASAIIDGPGGTQAVLIRDIDEVVMKMVSPGPE